MQILQAGGLTLLTDEQRQADEDNPKGYFELESIKNSAKENSWAVQAEGKVVKMIAQLLTYIPHNRDYRIIFMQRPLNEVIASQRTMLERSGKKINALSDRRLAHTYLQQIKQVRSVLAQRHQKVTVLAVDYHQALEDPQSTAVIVNDFFGQQLDEAAMVAGIINKYGSTPITVASEASTGKTMDAVATLEVTSVRKFTLKATIRIRTKSGSPPAWIS